MRQLLNDCQKIELLASEMYLVEKSEESVAASPPAFRFSYRRFLPWGPGVFAAVLNSGS